MLWICLISFINSARPWNKTHKFVLLSELNNSFLLLLLLSVQHLWFFFPEMCFPIAINSLVFERERERLIYRMVSTSYSTDTCVPRGRDRKLCPVLCKGVSVQQQCSLTWADHLALGFTCNGTSYLCLIQCSFFLSFF